MATLDSNGIMMLEETDPITPFQTLINGMQAATSTVIGGIISDLGDDTGWVNMVPNTSAGYTLDSSRPAQYRRIGNVVHVRGGFSGPFSAGFNVVVEPNGYPSALRPDQAVPFLAIGTNTATSSSNRSTINASGTIQIGIPSGTTASTYEFPAGTNWIIN